MTRKLEARIDCVKYELMKILGKEFKNDTYKEAAAIIGIPESNYWRFMNTGTIGGKSLFFILTHLIDEGKITI